MRFFAGRDQIRPAITIDVTDRDIFYRANLVAGCDRDIDPFVGISWPKCDAQVIGVFMY